MTPATLDLVIGAAFIHAAWNILLKRVRGGLSFIWFVSLLQGLAFAPWIAWVVWSERPRLGAVEWTLIVGSAAIHITYLSVPPARLSDGRHLARLSHSPR